MRPGMSDGRCFTSYLSSGILNENIQKEFKVVSGPDFRTYLQQNGKNIMNEFKKMSVEQDVELKKIGDIKK